MTLAEERVSRRSGEPVREGLLTSRERTVLRLVVERYDNQDIADLLGISKRTVETHVASLLRKLAVPDRRTLISTSGPDVFRARLTRALRSLQDPHLIQRAVAELVGEHLGADDAECRTVGPVAAAPLDLATGSPRTLVVADAHRELEPAVAAVWAAYSLRAGLVVPHTHDGACVAALGVFTRQPHDWSAEDVALLEETAERLWARVERLRLAHELSAERRVFRTLADALPHPVWRTDQRGRLVYANRAFRTLTGLGPGDEVAGLLDDDALVCFDVELAPDGVGPEAAGQIGVARPPAAPTDAVAGPA